MITSSNTSNKDKILVTGGTGLVGSHLLAKLAVEGRSIRAIHRKTADLKKVKTVFSYYADAEMLFKKIEWVVADVTKITTLKPVFKDITQVYHCAAIVSFLRKDEELMYKTNIEGTANMVNISLDNNVQKFCYISSIATLDKGKDNILIDEHNEWNPESNNYPYAISKHGGEMEVWRASQEGLPVVIVNPGIILGAGFWQINTGRFFTNAAKNFAYYTTGKTGFVGVRDVVKAMLQLTDSNIVNQRYILVSENASFKTLMTQIAQNLNTKPPTKKVSPIMANIAWRLAWIQAKITSKQPLITKHSSRAAQQTYCYSSDKIKQALDFDFETLKTTLNRAAKLFLAATP